MVTPDRRAPQRPRAGRRRPTIHDVAREAGVSYGTVSRFLNGGKWVSAEARRSIERAISRTGYTANPHARSLVTGRSGSIAFLLPEPQHVLFEDPNLSILLRGVTQAVSDRQLALILMIASTDAERDRVVEYLAGGHVDGVLLISSHNGDPLLPRLAAADVPVVATGRPGFEESIGTVTADDFAGARSAVDHLLRVGRRRIATITGPQDTSGGTERLRGFRQSLASHDRSEDEALIEYGDWSRDSGSAAMRKLLDRCPDLDAVFAANDLMAAGALTVLRDAGRIVPDDVHLVGFDDTGLAETLDPPLTTVRQPLDRISREMVRLITENADSLPMSVTIPTKLIIRESG
ncbi:LacI family DNA-binding transcriptional regulator [Microlunatus elymi]|uniref:LacI family DNA-binding transcriptional regulator n=1 Tax=Microlunatus elymi TaxID=2596828 RepID=UPI001D184433|nr:LacI family DNA-binding transcriptional regulator [Microlunatus elymi]